MGFFKAKGKTLQTYTNRHSVFSTKKVYNNTYIQLEITIIYTPTDEVCGIHFFLSDCKTKIWQNYCQLNDHRPSTTPVRRTEPDRSTMTCKNPDICL